MTMIGARPSSFVYISSTIYAEVVAPGSKAYSEAQRLQEERFSQVSTLGDQAGQAFVQATNYAPGYTMPVVVRQTRPQPAGRMDASYNDLLLGTARLELAGSSLTESVIQLRPGSLAEYALKHRKAAEIGGFATHPNLDKATLLDVIDAVVAIILQESASVGIEQFWIFPRNGLMSLMTASIPGLLPPYEFSRSPDVLCWKEGSLQLQHMRALKLKGLGKTPEIYTIHRSVFEKNLAQRLAKRAMRTQYHDQINALLFRAMRQAQRRLSSPENSSSRVWSMLPTESVAQQECSEPPANQLENHTILLEDAEESRPAEQQNFLPFKSSPEFQARYLRALAQRSGDVVRQYKAISYDALDLQPGMRVLDVGCGIGIDLPALSTRIGDRGHVIGMDINGQFVKEARASLDQHSQMNTMIFQGNIENCTLPDELFDRVRADRVLQHVNRPHAALKEMWRMLQPGGILTVVEPDWKAMAVYPGSSEGGNSDKTWIRLLEWNQRHMPQPLIGRQLSALLHNVNDGGVPWTAISVRPIAFSISDWDVFKTILSFPQVIAAMIDENQGIASELVQWQRTLEEASITGAFYAMMPLFFARAKKA